MVLTTPQQEVARSPTTKRCICLYVYLFPWLCSGLNRFCFCSILLCGMFSLICWYVLNLGQAPTKKSKTKNQDEAEEEDAEAEDEEDPFDDLVSVSSEDSKGKSKGRSSGSKRSAPKVKVDQATKDEARKTIPFWESARKQCDSWIPLSRKDPKLADPNTAVKN